MTFIYHNVPEHMQGNMLYPVSELGLRLPTVYSAHQQKYKERPHVLKDSIPRIGCFWNDVLHFTAIHPQVLVQALQAAGQNAQLNYYEVDATKLEPEKTIVYLNTAKSLGARTTMNDFVAYDPEHLEAYANVPESSLEYYQQHTIGSEDFVLYTGIPLILYKGNFDITGSSIITA